VLRLKSTDLGLIGLPLPPRFRSSSFDEQMGRVLDRDVRGANCRSRSVESCFAWLTTRSPKSWANLLEVANLESLAERVDQRIADPLLPDRLSVGADRATA